MQHKINPLFLRCFLLVILISLIGMNGYTQTPASTTTIDGSSYDAATNSTLGIHNFRKMRPEELDYDDYDGSPFLHPEFVTGSLVRTNGAYLDSLNLKYDILLKSFIAKKDDGEEIYIDTKYCREIRMIIEGTELVFKRVDPKKPETFYQVLYDSDGLTFYKDETVKVVHGENSGISKTNSRFFKKEQYLVSKDREIIKMKRKKKDFWKYFNKEEVQLMEQYLKKNKAKLKSDKDYIAMFKVLPERA